MRVVVLDVVEGHPQVGGEDGGPGPGGVPGVQVGDDELRRRAVEAEQLRGRPLVCRPALEAAEVPDVRRDEPHAVAGEGEGVLDLGAGGEHDGVTGQRHRQRREAAGTAHRHGRPVAPAEDRVLAGHRDLAIVGDEDVRDGAESPHRVVVGEAQRFAGEVARGHDEHRRGSWRPVGQIGEEQVVQWRIGEHDTELVESGGHRVGHRGGREPRQQHDGPLGAGEDGDRPVGHLDHLGEDVEVRGHEREGLVRTVLAPAQLGDGRGVRRVAGQVVAADPLDRQDRPRPQRLDGERQGLLAGAAAVGRGRHERGTPAVEDSERRSAVVTGDGLGVVTAVCGVGILTAAARAHGEGGHRRHRPVVGQVGHDGEPRSAVRAGDEGMPVAPVGGVPHLAQTVLAHRRVRRNHGALAGGCGGPDDGEPPLARGGEVGRVDRQDPRQRWRLGLQADTERRHGLGLALDLDDDARRIVAAVSRQPQLDGEAGDVRAEAHSLDHAADDQPAPDPHVRDLRRHDRSQRTTRVSPASDRTTRWTTPRPRPATTWVGTSVVIAAPVDGDDKGGSALVPRTSKVPPPRRGRAPRRRGPTGSPARCGPPAHSADGLRCRSHHTGSPTPMRRRPPGPRTVLDSAAKRDDSGTP